MCKTVRISSLVINIYFIFFGHLIMIAYFDYYNIMICLMNLTGLSTEFFMH